MCSGGGNDARRRAQQQAAARDAQIAAANAAAAQAAADAAAEMQALQTSYNTSIDAHALNMAEAKAMNRAENEQIAARGLAASSTLRILGGTPSTQAPTAQTSSTKRKYPGTTQAKLSNNAARRSRTVGTNLSI